VLIVNSNNLHKFNQAYVFYCMYSRMHLVAIIFISGIYCESNILDYATQGIKKMYIMYSKTHSQSSEFTFLFEHVQIPPRVGRVEVIVDFVYHLSSFKLRKSAVLFVDRRWVKKLNEGSVHCNICFSRK